MVVSKWGSGLKILLSKKKTKNKIIWCCDLLNNGETLIYNKTKKSYYSTIESKNQIYKSKRERGRENKHSMT